MKFIELNGSVFKVDSIVSVRPGDSVVSVTMDNGTVSILRYSDPSVMQKEMTEALKVLKDCGPHET